MCGNALFLKLQKLKEDHVRQGYYYAEYISDQIDLLIPSVQVKRLFVSGKLPPSNSNELQKVCEEFMVHESACKSFVQHQEFLDYPVGIATL